MSLKIIGAGFGRTGTMSLKHALEDLGYGPCYHMIELTNQPEKIVLWEQALKGDFTGLKTLFEEFPSTTDFPGCLFYQELFRLYPGSKVILTVRDPDTWYESARKTIFRSYPSLKQLGVIIGGYPFNKRIRLLMRVGWLINKLIFHQTFRFRFKNREKAIATYLKHNCEVIANIPRENLLVFDVADGWEPLCRFLNVAVPDHPFPRTNSSGHFSHMKNVTLKAPVPDHVKRM